MSRLTVAFLWHMHQPYYVDCAAGRATLPWARLHGLKDYLDIPALARRFPSVKQTFNLVPSLVDQLEDYAQGRLTDRFLEVASRDAGELTVEDRAFLLDQFFSYNPSTMAAKLPRLEQLRRMKLAAASGSDSDAAQGGWREADFRDLQVLFHLAWSGQVLSARPLVSGLIRKGSGFTHEELTSLLDTQREFLGEVRPEYQKAAGEGTIEISASPYYHPILPLLCDTDSAREATPRLALPSAPFRHREDARLQIRESRRAFSRLFGEAPRGMWPSEGAISGDAVRLLGEEGVLWAASDEDVLFASLGASPGSLEERSRILHRPYAGPGGTILFFRDHFLSDRIGFVYSTWDAQAAASDFLDRLTAIADAAGGEERTVSIILDGENAWEFYPENGSLFLSALFGRIAESDRIEARTFGSIAETCARNGAEPRALDAPTLNAPALPALRAGSWIRADLTTWIGDEIKNRAWERLVEARAVLGPPSPDTGWGRSLLAAEGSDWFWWFGDEHSSAHDADFDRTFRMHLQNAYVLAGRDAPVSLAHSIAPAGGPPVPAGSAGPVTLVLDGKASDYFEWLAAGRIEADLGRGTMSRGGRTLGKLWYGIDKGHLALRIDTLAEPALDTLEGQVLVLELAAPVERRLRAPLRRGAWEEGPVRGCLDRVLEISVPLAAIEVRPGSRIELRILLEDGEGRRLESLPAEGFATFAVPEGGDGTDWLV